MNSKEVNNMPISTVARDVKAKSLVLRMENGVSEKGETLYTSKSFSNLRHETTDADVYNSAKVLESLQNKYVDEICIVENNILRV